MKLPLPPIALLTIAVLLSIVVPTDGRQKKYPSPTRFEKAVKRFEARDKKNPPPKGAVVCIGSSSMGGWHGKIKEDLSPLTVIPRGFGGSNMNDVLHYTDRVVIPYKPRAILLYEGDNDVAQGISPEKIVRTFAAFVRKVRKKLPKCRFYILAVKPSPSRWRMWPKMRKTNYYFARLAKKYKFVYYIDIASPMLDRQGKPKGDIFKKDKLHMNRKGYLLWKKATRAVMVKNEKKHEK